MDAAERYGEFRDADFDQIILKIKLGRIKCGRYSHLVKIDKKNMHKEKELFTNGNTDESERDHNRKP